MSAKNKVQEYFQSQRLPVPKYSSKQVGGSSHEPQWQSTVTNCSEVNRVISGVFKNKKAAEQDAASKLLSQLETIINEQKTTIVVDYCDLAIMVDLENQPEFLNQLLSVVEFQSESDSQITIYGIAAKNHSSFQKLHKTIADYESKQLGINIIEIQINSSRRDGADIGLSLLVGMLIEKDIFSKFIVVSNDHFAHALVDSVKSLSTTSICATSHVNDIIFYIANHSQM